LHIVPVGQGLPVPVQVPFKQVSVAVQNWPSLQAVPFCLIGLLHTPLVQVPASWH
jgi:hypothetical protein